MKAISENKQKGKAMVPKETLYAKFRRALYKAVENQVKFKDMQFDANGKCYLSRTETGVGYDQYTRGMIATARRKSNGKGWVIFFTLAMPTTNDSEEHHDGEIGGYSSRNGNKVFMRDLPVRLTINETPSGVKFLWFVKNKPQWGMSADIAANMHLYGIRVIVEDLFRQIEKWYSPENFVPIAKYLPTPWHGTELRIAGLSAHGIPDNWAKKLSGGTNPREILNKAYGKSGQHGLSKNAFGGIANFKYFSQQKTAYELATYFRSFPSHFFDKIKVGNSYDFNDIGVLNSGPLKYFFKYFNHKRIQDEVADSINDYYIDLEENNHRIEDVYPSYNLQVFYYNEVFSSAVDAGVMLKRITNRTIRKNILAFRGSISETHDLIMSEYNKLASEDRKIKYGKKHAVLDNQMVTNNIVSVLPKTTHDLVWWGSQQHNCIGGYGDRVMQSSKTIIVGFKNETTNDWIGHAELSNTPSGWIITKLRGKYNSILEDNDDKVIRKFIGGVFKAWTENKITA